MSEGLPELKAELGRLLADRSMQDHDLMVSHHPANLLIEALGHDSFDAEEKATIRCALLARLYDLERGAVTRSQALGDIDIIRRWTDDTFVDGRIPKRFTNGYIVKALNQGKADALREI